MIKKCIYCSKRSRKTEKSLPGKSFWLRPDDLDAVVLWRAPNRFYIQIKYDVLSPFDILSLLFDTITDNIVPVVRGEYIRSVRLIIFRNISLGRRWRTPIET